MQVKMTVDDALEFADEWVQGMTFHEESQGWRVVCAVLASEVRRLRDINSLDLYQTLKRKNLILRQQLLKLEQDFIELEDNLEGLSFHNDLLRNELTRERDSRNEVK
jgi:hypothetical protein